MIGLFVAIFSSVYVVLKANKYAERPRIVIVEE